MATYLTVTLDGAVVGYVPKSQASQLASFLRIHKVTPDSGCPDHMEVACLPFLKGGKNEIVLRKLLLYIVLLREPALSQLNCPYRFLSRIISLHPTCSLHATSETVSNRCHRANW